MKKKAVKKRAKQASPNGKIIKDIKIPVEYELLDTPVFVNSTVVRYEDGAFHVMMYNVKHPVVLNKDPNWEKKMESIKSIEAKCLGHFVLTPQQMKKSVKSFSDALERIESELNESVS